MTLKPVVHPVVVPQEEMILPASTEGRWCWWRGR